MTAHQEFFLLNFKVTTIVWLVIIVGTLYEIYYAQLIDVDMKLLFICLKSQKNLFYEFKETFNFNKEFTRKKFQIKWSNRNVFMFKHSFRFDMLSACMLKLVMGQASKFRARAERKPEVWSLTHPIDGSSLQNPSSSSPSRCRARAKPGPSLRLDPSLVQVHSISI